MGALIFRAPPSRPKGAGWGGEVRKREEVGNGRARENAGGGDRQQKRWMSENKDRGQKEENFKGE